MLSPAFRPLTLLTATPNGLAWSDPMEPPLALFADALEPVAVNAAVVEGTTYNAGLRRPATKGSTKTKRETK